MLYYQCLKVDSVKRGDIVDIYMGKSSSVGSEQDGDRPYIIVQNDIGNKFSPTVLGVPITDEVKKDLPTHMQLSMCNGVSSSSIALFEQIRVLDKSRIKAYRGKLSGTQMKEVDKKLKISLGIPQ